MINQSIRQQIQAIKNELIEIRHHLHQHPELSFEEKETAAFICKKLDEWGIAYQRNVAGYGIVGLISSEENPTTCIALRADMDALPIQELNDVPYKSKNQGVMHACGHDVHTSILLATLKILHTHKSTLKKAVKFIFQPGEEKLPGGARLMIEAGVLEKPQVENIFALHVFPELEVGKVGLKSGMYMASCDELHFTVNGKGGHAAMPHLNIDPIKAATKLIQELYKVADEHCPKDIPCVIAFGKIEGLGATNVIPDSVQIQGTFRTMNEKWRKEAHQLIQSIVQTIETNTNCKIDVNIAVGYPFLENNPELTESSRAKLKAEFGIDNVVDLPIRMTGEDFAFYAQKIPATFIRLGTRNERKGIIHAVHNAKFDIDEDALVHGVRILTSLV